MKKRSASKFSCLITETLHFRQVSLQALIIKITEHIGSAVVWGQDKDKENRLRGSYLTLFLAPLIFTMAELPPDRPWIEWGNLLTEDIYEDHLASGIIGDRTQMYLTAQDSVSRISLMLDYSKFTDTSMVMMLRNLNLRCVVVSKIYCWKFCYDSNNWQERISFNSEIILKYILRFCHRTKIQCVKRLRTEFSSSLPIMAFISSSITS